MNSDNNPKFLDEILHLRAENSSLYSEVSFLKDQLSFLRDIINSFINHA